MGLTSTSPGFKALLLSHYAAAVFATPLSLTRATDETTQPNPHVDRGLHAARDGSSSHMSKVWYVLLALLLCILLLVAYLLWRRWKRVKATGRPGRADALARDLSTWDPARARRRYWQGRWRSTEMTEEGLNENGEAPPPYIPKSVDVDATEVGDEQGPTIPLRVLTRDQANVKPPDYVATTVTPAEQVETPAASAENRSRARSSE